MQLNQNNTPLVANQYTYDAMSRLATVSDGTNTAAYSRISGSNLLNTTTITAGGSTKLTTTRNYDSQNRLTSISSVSSVPSVVKTYSYTYDDKDRRSRLDLADGSHWLYTYDAKGQIVSGAKYDSTNKAIPGQAFGYAYDDIGNLTTEQRGMTEMQYSYTSNLVNQYTQRLVPGIIPVTGQASADSTVSVWLKNHGANAAAVTRPTRDGEYFKAAIPVNNTAANVTEALEITAVKFNTTLDKDVVKTIDGSYTVPKTPQLFTNDDDGDMTGDGVWNYIWNGENRLIAIEKNNTTRLEFKYDYQGRRIEKKVYSWVNNTWNIASYSKFVYDGYKQIAEYDGAAGTMQKNYTWQPESTGKVVPLWLNNGGSVYYYIVDGNKNVTALIDSTGVLAAEYEYGQFGEILSKYGTMADINPFRFSSEFFDVETGLVYYNYRYYSPDLRRWISRDPIEEQGGVTLYAMVGNNPVNQWDSLGLLTKVQCDCAYQKAQEIFYEYIEKIWPWPFYLFWDDCDVGARAIEGLLRDDEDVMKGFSASVDRRGQFHGKGRLIQNGRGGGEKRFARFVRMHSVAAVTPNKDCKKYYKEMAFDTLERDIYTLINFEKEYNLNVNFAQPGYYLVDKNNPDNLLPGQTTPWQSTPGGIDLEL